MKFDINAQITVHQHIYQHGDVAMHGEMLRKLDDLIVQQRRGIMAVRQDIVDFSKKMDTATTAIGDRIQRLIDASTTLSSEEKAELQRISDGLDMMGKDPENPLPPIPPA